MTEYKDLHDKQEGEQAEGYGKAMYRKGFIDGLKAYAHWKDGEQYVGTCGTTLKEAVEGVEKTHNYNPRLPEPDIKLNDEDFNIPF